MLRARVRYAAPSAANGRNGGQTLGALLTRLRAESGLSVSRLAGRAVTDRRTVQRLERGQLRPRRSTLTRIAWALDPERRPEVLGQILAAAGDDIAPEHEGWSRYKTSRVNAAMRAGQLAMPTAWERAARLSAASESMFAASMTLLDQAAAQLGSPRSRDLMDLHDALGAEYETLRKQAGGSTWEVPPPRPRRGGPVDVSRYPPPLDNLDAMWEWVQEWRIREARLKPRTARERAIAATGKRERQKVRENPGPPIPRAADVSSREGDTHIRHLIEGRDDRAPVRHLVEGE
jgi:transcriptional regulator with XRE-family HTH domain